MSSTTPLRAAGYCRTSGEGQRDNTSIPRQKKDIERACQQNGWTFVAHYVDEAKSGSKIDGRDAFVRMMADAAKGKFDIVVPFDVTRFARDGVDIVDNAKALKAKFRIYVVDAKGQFDNRDHRNALRNFVHAGVTEHERLSIMERTIGGRVRRAEEGLPWCASNPVGRAFKYVDPEHHSKGGEWYITDKGRAIAAVLRRYVKGESLTALCREFGIVRSSKVSDWVWHGQLAGTYTARFDSGEIELCREVPVPGIPEVVPLALLEKVKAKLQHNRVFNRADVRKYPLSGFIRCGHCKRALTAQTTDSGTVYYRHKGEPGCTLKSVRGDEVEPAVLDYLYRTFLDEPAYNAAVARAMPSTEQREGLAKERDQVAKRLAKNEKVTRRLVDAVANGADVELLLGKQGELKAERTALTQRLEDLDAELASMPDLEQVKAAAMLTRIYLIETHKNKNWRALPYDNVKQFLHHLFGDSMKGSRNGVFVSRDGGGLLVATFAGQVDFGHVLIDGHATINGYHEAADALARLNRLEYEAGAKAAKERHDLAKAELRLCTANK